MTIITAIVDGEIVETGTAPIAIINPADDELVVELPEADDDTVDRAVAAARRRFDDGVWRNKSVEGRQAVLRRCGDAIEAAADQLADIECSNTGIPLSQIRSRQVLRAADNFRFFADQAPAAAGVGQPPVVVRVGPGVVGALRAAAEDGADGGQGRGSNRLDGNRHAASRSE